MTDAQPGYRAIDSDGHVLEPADLWTRYIEPRYRELIGECIESGEDFGLVLATGDGAVHEIGTRASVALVLEVLEDKLVNDGAGRTKLRAGKVVSSLQYDLKSLHRQGVKMKRVEQAQLNDPTDTSFLQ